MRAAFCSTAATCSKARVSSGESAHAWVLRQLQKCMGRAGMPACSREPQQSAAPRRRECEHIDAIVRPSLLMGERHRWASGTVAT